MDKSLHLLGAAAFEGQSWIALVSVCPSAALPWELQFAAFVGGRGGNLSLPCLCLLCAAACSPPECRRERRIRDAPLSVVC